MKRFLLLNSPIYWDSTKENEQYLSPLGLGYIATYLDKAGIEVELVDCVKEKKSVNQIVDLINQRNPDCWGINIFSQNYELVRYIFENVKSDKDSKYYPKDYFGSDLVFVVSVATNYDGTTA